MQYIFLKKIQIKVDWEKLSENSAIFTYDYDKIKETKHDINKDLIEWIWKPEHYNKCNEQQIDKYINISDKLCSNTQ